MSKFNIGDRVRERHSDQYFEVRSGAERDECGLFRRLIRREPDGHLQIELEANLEVAPKEEYKALYVSMGQKFGTGGWRHEKQYKELDLDWQCVGWWVRSSGSAVRFEPNND